MIMLSLFRLIGGVFHFVDRLRKKKLTPPAPPPRRFLEQPLFQKQEQG